MTQAMERTGMLPAAVASGYQRDTNSLYYAAKRGVDLVLSLVLLVTLSPLMVAIVILIKLDSPGPIIFKQERIGSRRSANKGAALWDVKPFMLYKFRSMHETADSALHEAHVAAYIEGTLTPAEKCAAPFKLSADPRVTRFGRLLRKFSLDELPQLVNVLKGEMSLVGPRPVPVYEAALYQPCHYPRWATLPGLTGLWQVAGRSETSFEEMIQLDLEYIQRQSLVFDLKLLLLTIPVIICGRGAA